ncbi:MAG: glycogen synthase GlgA [Elusimicrobia bacterium CG_4_9_14_3_um_filter_62_55]|nr:MAG: glycogen synthase GlgA [Elusimicrobia bacterium CG22_combo_CG10-13_8_21_14_all_63_91]PJA17443.1 MAG: glycogen synthase GlgA [Elusimicrobia bacterium CG_4_10_14_0_2_um_filter_63_34]PJB25485.1 MAG: glycogen synthase GlgA [Elusimicrobia bacterium CG_4_9_14_3_um_filter_62_55]
MNVVFAASEAVPFCKTGGLADVAGSLPQALRAGGERVSVFLPYYREAREAAGATREVGRFTVPLGGEPVEGRILEGGVKDACVYFIDAPRYFDRDGLYADAGGEHPDNADRFAFFSRAVIEAARVLMPKVDLFHAHDWQTAAIPLFLKTLYRDDPIVGRAGSLLTIHNLAFQGNFPKDCVLRFGLPWSVFTPEGVEFYDQFSFVKAGLAFADRINAVSPQYAREIASVEFGCGLDGLIRSRGSDVSGIINGIDAAYWDPKTDAHLPARYGPDEFQEGKAACKAALQRECGFDADPSACVFAAVSRVSHQKGLDLALGALEPRLAAGDRFVLVGRGDRELLSRFERAAARFPGRLHVHDAFDEPFAHRVYAGADIFLMPSRFEPCGLGQMIAMRYGTPPVAVATGGLADTVPPHGFLSLRAEVDSVSGVVEAARGAFSRPEAWSERVRSGMLADFSWDAPAERYRSLYREAAGVARFR